MNIHVEHNEDGLDIVKVSGISLMLILESDAPSFNVRDKIQGLFT